MKKMIYGVDCPYITEDERKLTQRDLDVVMQCIRNPMYMRYFDFFVNRIVSRNFDWVCKADYLLLKSFGRFGRFLGGRVLVVGEIDKDFFLNVSSHD